MIIRRPEPADRLQWEGLYAGYADFYGVAQTGAMRDRVWGWIHDPEKSTDAFVAEAGGHLVGLAHYRPFARPLTASVGGFLDDLYVTPSARGSGAAAALIAAIRAEGQQRGWSVLRWITDENNAPARKLYDRVAAKTAWVTYDIRL